MQLWAAAVLARDVNPGESGSDSKSLAQLAGLARRLLFPGEATQSTAGEQDNDADRSPWISDGQRRRGSRPVHAGRSGLAGPFGRWSADRRFAFPVLEFLLWLVCILLFLPVFPLSDVLLHFF